MRHTVPERAYRPGCCSHGRLFIRLILAFYFTNRVLPLGEFTVTIPEPLATLQGAVMISVGGGLHSDRTSVISKIQNV